jgi:hypothetical protein
MYGTPITPVFHATRAGLLFARWLNTHPALSSSTSYQSPTTTIQMAVPLSNGSASHEILAGHSDRIQIINDEKMFTYVHIVNLPTPQASLNIIQDSAKSPTRPMGDARRWIQLQYCRCFWLTVDWEKYVVQRPSRHGLSDALGTLLNRLFGTTFDVMAESKRQQTTKGKLLPQPLTPH